MKKMLSALPLAVAVLVVGLAFTVWDAEKVRARSTCPSGTQKFAHVCIEKTARSAAIFSDASATCAAARRRLPTSAELDAFRQQSGVTLANPSEWTSNFTSSTQVLAITDAGTYLELTLPTLDPFRCVA
jgi:hypothetical protein